MCTAGALISVSYICENCIVPVMEIDEELTLRVVGKIARQRM